MAERAGPLVRNLVAAWARMSSFPSASATSRADSARSAAGTTRSKKPAPTASEGPKISALMTTRLKWVGETRWRQISMAVSGIVSPMATSLAPILKAP